MIDYNRSVSTNKDEKIRLSENHINYVREKLDHETKSKFTHSISSYYCGFLDNLYQDVAQELIVLIFSGQEVEETKELRYK